MTRLAEPGVALVDVFPAFTADGASKQSGLSVGGGNFATILTKDGVVDATAVTIAEIGVSGDYRASFTPATAGFWRLEVLVAFSGGPQPPERFFGEYNARPIEEDIRLIKDGDDGDFNPGVDSLHDIALVAGPAELQDFNVEGV